MLEYSDTATLWRDDLPLPVAGMINKVYLPIARVESIQNVFPNLSPPTLSG
jgi:hypothetical protein